MDNFLSRAASNSNHLPFLKWMIEHLRLRNSSNSSNDSIVLNVLVSASASEQTKVVEYCLDNFFIKNMSALPNQTPPYFDGCLQTYAERGFYLRMWFRPPRRSAIVQRGMYELDFLPLTKASLFLVHPKFDEAEFRLQLTNGIDFDSLKLSIEGNLSSLYDEKVWVNAIYSESVVRAILARHEPSNWLLIYCRVRIMRHEVKYSFKFYDDRNQVEL